MNKLVPLTLLFVLSACAMVREETDAEFACNLISSRCYKSDEGANAGPLHKQATETDARDPQRR